MDRIALLWCRHAQELPSRHPDGTLHLRCARCGHERPNILYGAVPAFHRTVEPLAVVPAVTGIDWERIDAAATEQRRRYADIGARVRRLGMALVERNS